ncbi:MAG TPA: response regulator [Methanospirillum sp.]|uniref:response regulator n=1 Tax=Methanospirillum sp. TaxID=45200 RepID=UPI002C51698D|nr:response regulator [Methanospirillum sp.]HWQ64307.1 response regulator [Methanospirillum sp.]
MATIMVIDDSPFIVDIFVTMLERGGYTVYSANSGPEGIELLKSVTPDLILLDIMMEPMDGWETLVAVKQNFETKDIPVMMLTAKQLTPQEAQEYGMYIEDYILKPVTHSELYSAIEGVINRRQQIQDDMKKAKEGGFEELLINEYGRLVKSVEITKRLLKLLSATYDLSDPSMKLSDDINIAIRSMETNLKFQEMRVSEIREEFSGKPA